MPDKDTYIWFTDASTSGSLRHIPDFMRVKTRASPRVEQNVLLAEGMNLLVDTVDNSAEKVMDSWSPHLHCPGEVLHAQPRGSSHYSER